MVEKINFSLASSNQIEEVLGSRIEKVRLIHNMTQAALAQEAGVSTRTIIRLEKGEGISLDTFIRVMKALNLQDNLRELVPDLSVRPVDRVRLSGRERKRARPKKANPKDSSWTWGSDQGD